MEKLTFAIEDIDLREWSNSQFAELVMHVCAPGNNAHNLPFDEETMRRAIPSLVGKPILAKYNRMRNDAGTHEKDEVPIGFVQHESDITIEEKNGKPWIVASGRIWKIYAREMMSVLRERKEAGVSMEILTDIDVDEKGNKYIKNFVFAGITVLGKHINPAVPGAKLKMLKFAEMEKALESEKFACRYSVLDFMIPDNVKDLVQKGLDWSKEHGLSGSAANLAMARYLLREDRIDYEHARKMNSVANKRFANVKDETQPSEQVISSLLWGGLEGRKWIGGIVAKMNELDSQDVSLFNEETQVTTEEVVTEPKVDNFAEPLTNRQISDILEPVVREIDFGFEGEEDDKRPICGWLRDFDDKFVYVESKGRTYRFEYVIEALIAKISPETKTEVIRGGFVEVGLPIDRKKQAVDAFLATIGFSADEYIDPVAKVAFLVKEAKVFKDIVDSAKNAVGYMREELVDVDFSNPKDEDAEKLGMACSGMSEFMKTVFEDIEDVEDEENEEAYLFAALRKYAKVLFGCHAIESRKMAELKKFQEQTIERDKFAKVEELLCSVSSDLLEEDVTEFRTFAKELPMDGFDAFANSVRAKAYERAKSNPGKGTRKNTQTVHNFALADGVRETQTTGLWADLKNKSQKT